MRPTEKITLQELIDQGRTDEEFMLGGGIWNGVRPTSPGKCRITRKGAEGGSGYKYLSTDKQVEVESRHAIPSQNVSKSGNIRTHRG